MIWIEILISLVIALVLAAIFVPLLGWRRPGAAEDEATLTFVFFFALVFLITLAGGAWLMPAGPTAWGVAWFTFLVVGVITALLLAAVAPPERRRPARLGEMGETDEQKVRRVEYASLLVGALVLVLALAVAAAYTLGERRWQFVEDSAIEQVTGGGT